jgi:hypothetical protein
MDHVLAPEEDTDLPAFCRALGNPVGLFGAPGSGEAGSGEAGSGEAAGGG